ncbi:glycosyltransferase family 2 protein [Candidatus Collierbacteria bacterium]|nr:glycosyltransferase family 2 protein [Candidatus Collierbacteria bacterium]
MGLTVIILAKDDGVKLKKAVESVRFAGEVIVVKEKFPVSDFSEVRNRALNQAKGEWVLFVDSDEEVSQKLKEEINNFINKNYNNYNISGIYLKRRDRFLGKWLKYGETSNVKLLRLAKKGAGRWERPVHEVWKIKGTTGELRNLLKHYSHDSVEEMAEKLDRYSEMEAKWRLGGIGKLGKLGRLGIVIEMVLFPVGKFVQNYIFRLGFLDGMEGFIHAGMMSGHSFLVRVKILDKVQEGKRKYKKVQK